MTRLSSANSDNTDIEYEKIAEYERLQRQYRIMENDRKVYSQESERIINKQKGEMVKLNSQLAEIRQDLALIDSDSNKNKDANVSTKLMNVVKEKNEVMDLIKEEKLKHDHYKKEISQLETKIAQQNKSMGGINIGREHSEKVKKCIKSLETQLELTNNKYSEELALNRSLRHEIRNFDIEQKRFDQNYKKLSRKYNTLKQEIYELIDQSTSAYDSRDDAQNKMFGLKEKNDKDVIQHNAEIKELIRIIDHDRKLREFMNTKCKERKEDEQLVAWREEKEKSENDKKMEHQVDTVYTYEKAFARIREITGEDDIDLVVNKFIAVEDRNFAMFNFVNEQNNKIESISEKINKINIDVDEFSSEKLTVEANRSHMLEKLDNEINNKEKIIDETKIKQDGINKIIDQLIVGIESLFAQIGCSRSRITDVNDYDSNGSKVDENNMLKYMGIIEERINQLMLVKAYIADQKDDDYSKKNLTLLGNGPSKIKEMAPVIPPALGDESDYSAGEDESSPMTRDDLLKKAIKIVEQREVDMNKEFSRFEYVDDLKKEKAK